jgi:hypothetical protein
MNAAASAATPNTNGSSLHGGGNQPFNEHLQKEIAQRIQHEKAEIRRLQASDKLPQGANLKNGSGGQGTRTGLPGTGGQSLRNEERLLHQEEQLIHKEEKILRQEQLARLQASRQHQGGAGNSNGNSNGAPGNLLPAHGASIHHGGSQNGGGRPSASRSHGK